MEGKERCPPTSGKSRKDLLRTLYDSSSPFRGTSHRTPEEEGRVPRESHHRGSYQTGSGYGETGDHDRTTLPTYEPLVCSDPNLGPKNWLMAHYTPLINSKKTFCTHYC